MNTPARTSSNNVCPGAPKRVKKPVNKSVEVKPIPFPKFEDEESQFDPIKCINALSKKFEKLINRVTGVKFEKQTFYLSGNPMYKHIIYDFSKMSSDDLNKMFNAFESLISIMRIKLEVSLVEELNGMREDLNHSDDEFDFISLIFDFYGLIDEFKQLLSEYENDHLNKFSPSEDDDVELTDMFKSFKKKIDMLQQFLDCACEINQFLTRIECILANLNTKFYLEHGYYGNTPEFRKFMIGHGQKTVDIGCELVYSFSLKMDKLKSHSYFA
jgi:hypothetical protein